MNLINKYNPPDSTYFNLTAIEPDIEGDNLLLTEGEGSRRGWGRPKADYIEVLNTNYLTSVVIWNHHKHGGGQAWRHYRNTPDGWKRILWRNLDDGERMMILDAWNENRIPQWVDMPGKLKRDYLKPRELQKLEIDEQGTVYGYKYLLVNNIGDLCSPMYPSIVWRDRELEADKEPTEENSSGIYAMKSRKHPVLERYARENCVLCKLALSGTVVEANEGMRAQHAQVVELL